IGTTSTTADIETVLVINDLLEALGFERFSIRVNNRLVLNGLLQKLGLEQRAHDVLRALDKLAKTSTESVATEITQKAGATTQQAQSVLQLTTLSGANTEILQQLEPLVAGNDTAEQGLAQLAELREALEATGMPSERLQLDVSIARGLDYYTGMVVETFLGDLPAIGSVCSGGRYDNLAELYTNQQLPGVGASLGLDRLLAAMEELGGITTAQTPAQVLIPFFAADRRNDYLRLAAQLRAAGIGVEFYPELKKLGKQLQYANKKGFLVALIVGDDEFAAGQCQVKDLSTGGTETVALTDDAAAVISEVNTLITAQN
ncbi:MAG: histidine--tRNA ligase, partial [Bythopirellula sp.]